MRNIGTIIGTVDGRDTYYNEKTATVWVVNTNIMIVGARTQAEAVECCERNLKNFKKSIMEF